MSVTAADVQKKFGGALIYSGRIPEPLKKLRQWVTWKTEIPEGKDEPTKVPKNPHTGDNASSTDPKTWGTFSDAFAALSKNPSLDGIGFVFTAGDPYCGVDCEWMPYQWGARSVGR